MSLVRRMTVCRALLTSFVCRRFLLGKKGGWVGFFVCFLGVGVGGETEGRELLGVASTGWLEGRSLVAPQQMHSLAVRFRSQG